MATGGPVKDDQSVDLKWFLQFQSKYQSYPYTLLECTETTDKLDDYLARFIRKSQDLFHESEYGVDYHNVPIRDFGNFANQEVSESSLPADTSRTNPTHRRHGIEAVDIKTLEQFSTEKTLSWPSVVDSKPDNLKPDPRCRFILLEQASTSSPLMNLNRDILFRILTYHQVSPSYLNFISCANSYTGARCLNFGGFRAEKFLQHARGSKIKQLGRSGRHYQLSFNLISVRRDRSSRPNEDESEDGNQYAHPYREMSALVYHQFDVESGTAFWILTSPQDEKPPSPKTNERGRENPLWGTIRKSITGTQYKVASANIGDRFSASLSVFTALAKWTIGDSASYLDYLDSRLNNYMKRLVDPHPHHKIYEELTEVDVRFITHSVQTIQNFRYRVEDVCSVLGSLANFFENELKQDATVMHKDLSSAMPGHVKIFLSDLQVNIRELEGVLERAKALEEIAVDRQQFVQRVLENGTNQQMKAMTKQQAEMARQMLKDAARMKVFALVTLVLLPITVVSTIFSTPIFRYPDDTPSVTGTSNGISGQGYVTSTDALRLWGICAASSTAGCLLLAKVLMSGDKWANQWRQMLTTALSREKEGAESTSTDGRGGRESLSDHNTKSNGKAVVDENIIGSDGLPTLTVGTTRRPSFDHGANGGTSTASGTRNSQVPLIDDADRAELRGGGETSWRLTMGWRHKQTETGPILPVTNQGVRLPQPLGEQSRR